MRGWGGPVDRVAGCRRVSSRAPDLSHLPTHHADTRPHIPPCAGSVSSEGSLSLDEHEALLEAAEEEMVVS